jgi:hypothetical protein
MVKRAIPNHKNLAVFNQGPFNFAVGNEVVMDIISGILLQDHAAKIQPSLQIVDDHSCFLRKPCLNPSHGWKEHHSLIHGNISGLFGTLMPFGIGLPGKTNV